jgi:hypothetical protein
LGISRLLNRFDVDSKFNTFLNISRRYEASFAAKAERKVF